MRLGYLRGLAVCLAGYSGLQANVGLAQDVPRLRPERTVVALPMVVNSSVPDLLMGRNTGGATGVTEEASGGGMAVAQLSLGYGGLILGASLAWLATKNSGVALIGGGVGAAGGTLAGAYAACGRASPLGAGLGAAVGVLWGIITGNAFAEQRRDRDDGALFVAYVITVPLTALGSLLLR